MFSELTAKLFGKLGWPEGSGELDGLVGGTPGGFGLTRPSQGDGQ